MLQVSRSKKGNDITCKEENTNSLCQEMLCRSECRLYPQQLDDLPKQIQSWKNSLTNYDETMWSNEATFRSLENAHNLCKKTKDKCILWHKLISMLISSINYMHGHVRIWSLPGEVLGLFTCFVVFQFIWTAFIICDYISTM